MSRTSHVPYHQNVYDLLGIEPGEDPDAARMIVAHEAEHGPLPASVREWYLVPKVVPLTTPAGHWSAARHGTIWFEFSNGDQVISLDQVLTAIRSSDDQFACVIVENQACNRWYLRLDGSDNPPVWSDNDWESNPARWAEVAPTFSDFTADWFAVFYTQDWTHFHKAGWPPRTKGVDDFEKSYRNGLWLRSPAEPFAVPVIDLLTEQLGEAERTPRPGDVTTYTFRPDGGTVRVTADHPAHPEPLSAWWVHADTPERLAEFARLLTPWGTLRDTLRADTDAAREVWSRARIA